MEKIKIKNAYENNLKNINLEIPLDKFTCVTGCSGCGKSSLVFDTIYAESQRGFLEGMTGNLYGQKLMDKPKVESIENLRPALSISQNYYNVNPRSTVGTTTEISYYLRSLFSIVNSSEKKEVSESLFSSNNPSSFCKNCSGLGVETIVSESLMIPNRNIKLIDGAILFFKGPPEGKEINELRAICEHYGIDINKKISDLSKKEVDILLYSNDKIKYRLSYKEGKRRKQHFVYLQGAIASINEKIKHMDASSSGAFSKYMESVPCHVCGGSKFSAEVLSYKVNGLNYSDVEGLELSKLYYWLNNFNYESVGESKKALIAQLIDSMLRKIKSLIELDLGYLNLSRSIPTLSGGERQRLRFADQLNCPLKGLIYILDEPCKGLHYHDVGKIITATHNLVEKGNTVIAIEHNKPYICSADNIIELGPKGGPEGGYVIYSGCNNLKYIPNIEIKRNFMPDSFLELKNICYRNIKNQDVKIPIGRITTITGASGSGKTSLSKVISTSFFRKNAAYCSEFTGWSSIKRLIEVNQSPIGKTPRSTIVSYLEIYDDIREAFAKTSDAKNAKCPASMFSMNVKGGRCECCQGTGLQKIELNYLPSSYILCPECNGKRFKNNILSIRYHGKNIQEILDSPISEIYDLFSQNKKVHSTLTSIMELGLGYLKLGQMSMNLSGGEAQRIKLAKALGIISKGKNLYILDEPTSGLNDADINNFESILVRLKNSNETIIVIEHNLEFVSKMSDWIVDFGLKGGSEGGKVVAQGIPETVFKNKAFSLYGL